VFRPKIVSSVSTSNGDRHGRGLTSLMSRAHVVPDSEGEPTLLTTMCDNSRPFQPRSKPIPVDKSKAISRVLVI
jgi:hypothetical protein